MFSSVHVTPCTICILLYYNIPVTSRGYPSEKHSLGRYFYLIGGNLGSVDTFACCFYSGPFCILSAILLLRGSLLFLILCRAIVIVGLNLEQKVSLSWAAI